MQILINPSELKLVVRPSREDEKDSPSDIHRMSVDLLEDDIAYSNSRSIVLKKKKVKQPEYLPALAGSVKDMPAYDPDSEILSLAFTIPSWINSIDRTRSAANLAEVSSNARHRLEEELTGLKLVVDIMLSAINQEEN